MPVINKGIRFWKCAEELLLDYLNERCGSRATITYMAGRDGGPPILAASYIEYPAADYVTAFTVGLSSTPAEGPDGDRHELMISVKSSDAAWARAIAVLAARYRGHGDFRVGDTVSLSDEISRTSAMRSFLVHNPSLLDLAEEPLSVEDRRIRFLQLYPLHDSEVELAKQYGHQAFIDARPALSDVSRAAVSADRLEKHTQKVG